MKYYIAVNKQEYLDPADAEKYGGGLVGYRETTTEVVPTTYTSLTGQKPPESPVDHVITQPPVNQVVVQPVVEPIKVVEPVKAPEIVKTEELKPVQNGIDLNAMTDEQLRGLCKEKKMRAVHLMRRETMIKKLS
jgi:hypothetical protein